jgi:hypothetical protein
MLAIAGCGGSDSEPSGAGGAAGTMQVTGGSGSGGNAGVSGAVAEPELFSDPNVPDCLQGPSWQLTGTIGSEQIMLDDGAGITSNIEPGSLYVLGLEPGGGITVGDSYHPLILTWDGSVMERGTSRPLTGKRFLIPGGDPAMPSGYCIVTGDIGPTTYSPNVLFKFRIGSVQRYESGACAGEVLPASLAGCMLRYNEYLP